jgi:hypothetical protein
LYVVIWEPKHGYGGGHQLVTDPARADVLRWLFGVQKPDCKMRVESAEDYAAAAAVERGCPEIEDETISPAADRPERRSAQPRPPRPGSRRSVRRSSSADSP